IIRLNWLCNPTGKVFKFRPVDWLVERNNLYTKVIFAGTGSNHTLQHIINKSPLIELYRECHIMIENGFHLKNRTMKHAPPDMTKTLQKLRDEIQSHSPHKFVAGRRADYQMEDEIVEGMTMLMWDKEALMDCDGEVDVMGPEDVIDY
ncbi:hypothetical protein EV424DRAFT_1325399, partial [Suillus variegatus]